MKRLHVMSNSHLDREHRHGFQETRFMLVKMMDDIINIMEQDENYKFFTLDGQAIVLDDYLEAKPLMRERLKKLIADGRILIGPWYSLVDCYSVNPESIIRNLLVGDRACREFGKPMKLGYSIFSFGQMAQLPQIYAGFGIHDIVFYKGASSKAFPYSEFIWRAPDGSEAFTTRLGKEKRWNFFFDFDIPVLLGGDAKKPGWQSKFTYPVRLCHMNDEQYKNQYSLELETDVKIREDKIEDALNTVMDLLSESASENVFLAFEGTDFTSPIKEIPETLELANRMMKEKLTLIHSNPIAYFKEVKEDIDPEKLLTYEGEMRFGPINHVHAETMGTNTDIKQAMFHAENTIINYAEPIYSILLANGLPYEKEMLDLTWKYLLATHAHDSIHGSGDPKIKTDNLNRLAQVQELADSLVRRGIESLCSMIDLTGSDEGDICNVIFNTTPYPRNEVIQLTIDLPQDERTESFTLVDNEGNDVPYYQISKEKFNLAMVHRQNRPKSNYCDRFVVMADIQNIPPMGYKTIKIGRVKGDDATSTNPFPLGIFPFAPIAKSGNVLDNGRIRAVINTNGSVDVYDYETKKQFKNLNLLTDSASAGDFWVHRQPYHINTATAPNNGEIELISNSSLSATYKVTLKMELPEGLNEDRTRVLNNKIANIVTVEVTLKKDSKRIDFKTKIENKSRDHMLVASFPTGILTEKAAWESPFEVRYRDIDKFTNDHLKKGSELERQAMQNFMDVSDGINGVALFTKGLKEAGTSNDNGAVINLTLFRATSNTFPIHNDLLIGFENETSQCLGTLSFEYAILLHHGDYKDGNIIEESRKYIVPPVCAELGSGTGGFLPKEYSFVQIENNNLILGGMKRCEEDDGLILRLYNPTEKEIVTGLTFAKSVKKALFTNMNEEAGEIADLSKIEIPAYKIITLKVVF